MRSPGKVTRNQPRSQSRVPDYHKHFFCWDGILTCQPSVICANYKAVANWKLYRSGTHPRFRSLIHMRQCIMCDSETSMRSFWERSPETAFIHVKPNDILFNLTLHLKSSLFEQALLTRVKKALPRLIHDELSGLQHTEYCSLTVAHCRHSSGHWYLDRLWRCWQQRFFTS